MTIFYKFTESLTKIHHSIIIFENHSSISSRLLVFVVKWVKFGNIISSKILNVRDMYLTEKIATEALNIIPWWNSRVIWREVKLACQSLFIWGIKRVLFSSRPCIYKEGYLNCQYRLTSSLTDTSYGLYRK